MLIDSHCHLFLRGLNDDLPAVLERAAEKGVTHVICVGIDLETSRACLEIATRYPNVYASAGVHPHDAGDVADDYLHQLEELLDQPKMVAVGEIGLDYYRNLSDPALQKRVFREHVHMAQALGKPVIFHNRNADRDVLTILQESGITSGVAHCFSSDLKTAQAFIELGFYISFAGNLTYKNSPLPEVVKALPLNKVLVETDAPFLSPLPHRGKINEPGRTRYVAEKLAEILKLPLEEVALRTRSNTESLFGFPSD